MDKELFFFFAKARVDPSYSNKKRNSVQLAILAVGLTKRAVLPQPMVAR